jgi:glycogen(starch) synthase
VFVHVLITADTVGGVWSYTRELVTGLVRRGIRVTLVSFGRIPSETQMAWLDDLPTVQYFPTGFRLEWMPEADRDLADSMMYLHGIVRESKPDLLHLSQFCYGALDVDVPRMVVAHSDVFSWNEAVHGSLPVGRWAEWYYGVVSAGLAGANLVVTPSRWMLDQVEHHYGAMRSAQVIYNGCTPELFQRAQCKQPIAASAGRLWDQGKQSRLLMQLQPPPLPITLAGAAALDDQGAPELKDASSIGQKRQDVVHPVDASTPSVDCSGELSECAMRKLLGRAAIYIATSKYEPFGLAPLEAAFSGCALVANDIASLREVWGSAAVYFRKNDANSLREALAMLHGSPELRLRYANLAYQRACRQYTAARMVDEYVRAYRSLLQQKVRAA